MTREEIIKSMSLQDAIQVFKDTNCYGTMDIAKSVLLKALEQEPRWIPVSERYPKIEDEYKYFLVTDSKGKVSVQEFFISLDEDPQPYFSGMVDVIAWMSLPTPYKPQESEET